MGDIRFLDHLRASLDRIEADGLMKRERLIEGAQGAHVTIGGRRMLNLCANNYLGLADDPRLLSERLQVTLLLVLAVPLAAVGGYLREYADRRQFQYGQRAGGRTCRDADRHRQRRRAELCV